jgi:tetraacyldisaccharide 4'-kinase
MNSDVIFLEAFHKPSHIYDSKARKDRGLSFVSGKKTVLVSSIGDPAYFEDTVEDLGAMIIEHMKFNDHHDYRTKDVERIIKICDVKAPDLLLTTEKDAVKFARMSFSFGRYSMMALAIRMDIASGRELLIDRLRSLRIG